MAENPELASTGPDTFCPVPFPGERLLCTRRGMKIEIKGIRGRTYVQMCQLILHVLHPRCTVIMTNLQVHWHGSRPSHGGSVLLHVTQCRRRSKYAARRPAKAGKCLCNA